MLVLVLEKMLLLLHNLIMPHNLLIRGQGLLLRTCASESQY